MDEKDLITKEEELCAEAQDELSNGKGGDDNE